MWICGYHHLLERSFNSFLLQLLQDASVDVSALTTLAIKESKHYGCTIKVIASASMMCAKRLMVTTVRC